MYSKAVFNIERKSLFLSTVRSRIAGVANDRQWCYLEVGCSRNSVDTEFRYFLLPSIQFSVQNWLKFRGITLNSSICLQTDTYKSFLNFNLVFSNQGRQFLENFQKNVMRNAVYGNIVFHHAHLCTIIITYLTSVGIFIYRWNTFERYHIPVTIS